jgi:adenosine deaminase
MGRALLISYADYLRLLPKVELHCHLIATIRAETLIELADAYHVQLPSNNPLQLFDYDNIADFLAVFHAASRVFQSSADFARVAYEGVADAVVAGNLRYREYFVNAVSFPGLGYADVIDGVIDGLRRAEADFDVGFGVIAAVNRSEPVARGFELLKSMLDQTRPEVVGLGQDYLAPDNTESPELWTELYRLAGEHGINRTAHVGEILNSRADSVRVALIELGCTRIDHGYHVLDDPDVVALARDRGVPFTCTPSSTRILSGWDLTPDHPIAQMIRGGLHVTLATDDPTLFRTDIGHEYVEALPAMGFGPDIAKRITLNGVDATWQQPQHQARLRASFEAQIQALDALLDTTTI